MSTERVHVGWLRERYAIVDFTTVAVGAVMLCIHALVLSQIGTAEPINSGYRDSASSGVGLVVWVVVESVIVVAIWRFRHLLPAWLRNAIVKVLKIVVGVTIAAAVILGLLMTSLAEGAAYVAVAVAVMAAAWYTDTDPWIATHDAIAVVLGAGVALFLGRLLGPVPMVVVLALALAWDYAAVDLSELMGDLVKASAAAKIPNYVAIPQASGLTLAEVRTFVQGHDDGAERPGALGVLIGLGDFVIPSALLVSLVLATGEVLTPLVVLPAVGIYAGIPALAAAEGMTPALPYLNTGALVGLVVALILFPDQLAVVLG